MSGRDREGERKRIAADVSKLRDDIETGVSMRSRDESGGCPFIGQVVSGMQATRARSAASVWNRRRRTRKRSVVLAGERECPEWSKTVRD